jgi:glycosyltransferase involved in cell wall biosynthesis
MTLRVGFMLIGGKNWTGGYNYLINLFRVLADEASDRIEPVLFVGNDVSESEIDPFVAAGARAVERDACFDSAHRQSLLVRSLVFGRVPRVEQALRRQRIDVVFEAATFLGWQSATPSIAWIPDLQHRVLPHLFSRMARARREIGFRIQIASRRSIMCSSEDTRAHIEQLYPVARENLHAVRFAVRPGPPIDEAAARAVADKYGLPARYFFMPNQFWAHKNHRLVLEALRRLSKDGRAVTVMATGLQYDPRNSTHVPSLLGNIAASGLGDRFITPGLVPYEDLRALMQACTAMLNPSLFEGWSTTVEEAKACGVPMLLSDLPVHREQAEGQAIFFDRYSPAALAEALDSFPEMDSAERATRRTAAMRSSTFRTLQFANDFVRVAETAFTKR